MFVLFSVLKADEAKKDFKERIKEATVLYNRRSLFYELQKDFPTEKEEDAFLDVRNFKIPLCQKRWSSFLKIVSLCFQKREQIRNPSGVGMSSAAPN